MRPDSVPKVSIEETAPVGLVETDPAGRIIRSNPFLCKGSAFLEWTS